MCPDSLTRVVSDAQGNTYDEPGGPASISLKIAERKSQEPNKLFTPVLPDTNFLGRSSKFWIEEWAPGFAAEGTFTQEGMRGPEYFAYLSRMLTGHKSKSSVTTLTTLEQQQILKVRGQITIHSFSVSTENLPISNKSELIDITDSLVFWGYPDCARQVDFLKNDDDFEEGEEPLSLASAQSFLEFVSDTDFRDRFSKLGEPALGLSPDGTLGATWRIADNKHLLIEFRRKSVVSFAMIGPNPASPEDGKFRLNGRNTREEVIKTLHNQGVTNWVAH